jgi:hypothetical protein
MAEPNNLHLYRNSTLGGDPIPLDVLLSAGLIIKDFSAVASDGTALPSAPELLVVYGDDVEGCFIQLDAGVVIPADGVFQADLHYIPPGVMKVIDANGAAVFGIISASANPGAVLIECAYAYKDARNKQQHNRT